MAKATFFRPYTTLTNSLGYEAGEISGIKQSGSQVVVSFFGKSKDIWKGRNLQYSGSLSKGGSVIGGQLESVIGLRGGQKAVQVTGFNTSASEVFNFLRADDAQGLFSYLFSGDDSLKGSQGNDSAQGFAGNDRMLGRGGKDFLIGGAGNDVLLGGGGNDILVGADYDPFTGFLASESPLEKDVLVGGGGADVFVLGDWYGNDFYNDGGNGDYALIEDFNLKQGDAILVAKSLGSYTLQGGISLGGDQSGTGIFGATGDLIALVRGASESQVASGLSAL